MRHGALFNGVGGFCLAAHWIGWENVMSCEIDEFCNKVTKYHFPNCIQHGDIKTTDFSIYRGRIDVLTGGDPCQPNSVAGLGKGTADHRYLWPEKFRAVREIRPPWVVNENVIGSISNGVLDIKINDLESEGYTCQPYCIPAEAVGALHQRERVWLVAYNPNFNRDSKKSRRIPEPEIIKGLETKRNKVHFIGEPVDLWTYSTHPDTERFKEQHLPEKPGVYAEGVSGYFGFGANAHGHIPRNIIESAIVGMLDGLPEGMDYTRRIKRIQAYGNAIAPQVAYEIFKAIEQYEKITQ